MDTTPEYCAFRNRFTSLVSGIEHDVLTVATKTFEKNMISRENLSKATNQHNDSRQRAIELLQKVLAKIEIDRAYFNTFVSILQKVSSLKELAEELRSERTRQRAFNLCCPGKPTASDVTQKNITLEWEKPNQSDNVEAYVVRYRCADNNSAKPWKSKLTDNNANSVIITNLTSQTKYIFKVRSELADGGVGNWSKESDPIETKPPPIHLSKPIASVVTHDSIKLQWEKAVHENVESYVVRYRSADDQDKQWKRKMTAAIETELTITNLSTQTMYLIKIRPELEDGRVGTESEVTVTTKPPPLAVRLSREAQLKRTLQIEGLPSVYELPEVTYAMRDEEKKIAKCLFGDPALARRKRERVLMLVGATGDGKSTLIEFMVNYILGVKWEYDFRFQMIKQEARSQTESQTRFVTAYTFFPVEGSALDYTLTIIDTPGYGDTRGIKCDHELTQQIKQFFSIPADQGGIDHIDGVGFVAKAGSTRLTPTQQYIFDSILEVFGEDMENSIFLMITFCDAGDPEVLEAIKAANIPVVDYFKFNNSALYAKNNTSDIINSSFWTMGIEALTYFFGKFENMHPRDLQLTRETLEERNRLETHVEVLHSEITSCLDLIRELRDDEAITAHQLTTDSTVAFLYEVEVMKKSTEQLPPDENKHITTCSECHVTCHYPCTIKNNTSKYNCAAMEGSYLQRNKDSHCVVCPGKCHWTKHVHTTYKYVYKSTKEERTLYDLLEKYSAPLSSEQHHTTEDMLQDGSVAKVVIEKCNQVFDLIKRAQESTNKLDKIALKKSDPSHETSSQVAYIEVLIAAERRGGKKGCEERIEALKVLKERAQVTVEVSKSRRSRTI